MFVAIRFSWRRFRHQMDLSVLMWKQTLTLPPWSSVCNANIASNAHTEPSSSILKWPSLDRLSTNCTPTFGSSHCRLLIFSPNEISEIPAEGQEKRDGDATSSRKWKQCSWQTDVLHRTVTSVTFRMLLFFVIYAHWPQTYFFPHRPRKGHRDFNH